MLHCNMSVKPERRALNAGEAGLDAADQVAGR
ncbi:hypothetical protein X739_09095 [Mesorhizobium sp. LNHC220B00]|nr:hypothetical protein X739_09095 [Mesorhizobium sp. LNHC220B00]